MDKTPEDAAPSRKRAKKAEEDEEEQETHALALREKSQDKSTDQGGAMVAVKRGSGKGLKAVQTSQEQTMTSDKADGTKIEAKTKVKEQKIYTAKSNAHVETKIVSEDNRKKVRRDGTVTITSSTTVKKVSYM